MSSCKAHVFLVGKGKNESMITSAWEHNSPRLTGKVFLSQAFQQWASDSDGPPAPSGEQSPSLERL